MSLRHIISIFVGIVTPSLIISKALNIPLEAQNYLLGMVLIIYGILTLVEVQGFSVFRIKFLSIQGTSFHFIPPLILTDQDLIKKGPTPVKALGPLLTLGSFGSFVENFGNVSLVA